MVECARDLRSAGLAVDTVSVGSTPTFSVVDHLDGVDEARPGNSVFYDVHQATIGSAELGLIAMFVLATVVGVYPERRHALVDAGALALSQDAGPVAVDPDCGYGRLLDLESRPLVGLKLRALSQEHGLVEGSPTALRRLTPGERVVILPNHSCLAAACFDTYHVARDGNVVDLWRPCRGWY
jgi:D-serine deaminase-like pyridoxal phosphate-dependent protein